MKDTNINIEQIKKDANSPESFLRLLIHLTPVAIGKTYRFAEDTRPRVYRTSVGVWVLEDMSKEKDFPFINTSKVKLPTGDIWEATKKQFGIFDINRYNKGEVRIARTVCRLAGLTFENYIK